MLLKTPLATHYPKFMFFLPLWLIVAFGLYAAIKVLLSVARFPDCTKDYHELMRDIDATKEELLARGVKIKD